MRTFRLFVSSTFEDLREERNALQREVFPRLRRLCAEHGTRFQAIDLRWGVPTEASLDQRTMSICLAEVARCQEVSPRPNFLVLLGDRYGWRPLPDAIDASRFESILDAMPADASEAARGRGLALQWYRRDDNQVPAVYRLRPRTGDFEADQAWAAVESELREAFDRAVESVALTPAQRSVCTASATEQEIERGALQVDDAREHVFCFFRRIQGPYPEADARASERLVRLKSRLREKLPAGNIHEYTAQWSRAGDRQPPAMTLEHLPHLCEDAYERLSRVILDELHGLETADPLDTEIERHDALALERAKAFVGRAEILTRIEGYLQGAEPHPLVIHGPPGSGLSALLARVAGRLRTPVRAGLGRVADRGAARTGPTSITRFLGATPASSDTRSLLRSICRQIARAHEEDDGSVPSDVDELSADFRLRLSRATAAQPLVLFLDALDRLDDAGEGDLGWLPIELPPHVRLVLSTARGSALETLTRVLPDAALVELGSMTVEEGSRALDRWLAESGRTLQAHQRREVLDKFALSPLPLYLKLAFEEARLWPSYAAPSTTVLASSVPGLLRQLLGRLANPSNHGEPLTRTCLGLLAAAKNGLSEDELLDLLAGRAAADDVGGGEVWEDFIRRARHTPPDRRLPVAVWSRFYSDLEPYLSEVFADGASLLRLASPHLKDVIREDYLAEDEGVRRHEQLARYFTRQPLFLDEGPGSSGVTGRAGIDVDRGRSVNLRKLSEQPFQSASVGAVRGRPYEVFADFEFMEAKCSYVDVTRSRRVDDVLDVYGGVYALLDDCRRALDLDSRAGRPDLLDLSEALRARSHVLSREPALLGQEVANHLAARAARTAELARPLNRHLRGGTWLRLRPDESASAVVLTLRDADATMFPICRFVPTTSQALVCSHGTLALHDVGTGRRARTLHLDAPGAPIDASVAANGRSVALLFPTGDCELWNLAAGQRTAAWQIGYDRGHRLHGGTLALSADGRVLATLRAEGLSVKLRVWNTTTRALLAERELDPLEGLLHDRGTFSGLDWETALAPLQVGLDDGGRIAAGAVGRLAEAWDWREGRVLWKARREVRALHGMRIRDPIRAVAVSRGGDTIAVGSDDDGVQLVDLEDGRPRHLGTPPGRLEELRFGHDDALLAGVTTTSVNVWRTADGEVAYFERCARLLRPHVDLASGTDTLLVTRNDSCTLHTLDAVGRLRPPVRSQPVPDPIRAAAVSDDGALMAVSTGTVVRVSRPGGELLWEAAVPFASGQTLCLSGAYLMLAGTAGSCRIWRAATGEPLGHVEIDAGVRALVPHPEQPRVILGTEAGECLDWQWRSGSVERCLPTLAASVRRLALTPDGGLLAVAIEGEDHGCLLWDLRRARVHRVLAGHEAWINAVAFSAGGDRVATAGEDRTVRVWDTTADDEPRVLLHRDGVDHVRFLDIADSLLSVGADGWCTVWSPSSGRRISAYACEHAIEAVGARTAEITLVGSVAPRFIHLSMVVART